ncbi:MAG: phosphoesterase [Deltaproteobacteria bacterium]|nr:phosphoesterase [Deltaproteobacteria bacterium]
MRLKILHHGNCFDGAASAALFGRFFTWRHGPGVEIAYQPMQHQQGDPFPEGIFDADVHAVVDFRYSPSPKLDWWFDHHQSAFQPASDRATFEADGSGQKFWDPKAPSNTGFLRRVAQERFGFRAPELDELCRWADVIDSAAFPSAAMAVRLEEPALRIMTVLEATADPALPGRVIEGFARGAPLAELAAQPWLAGPLAPMLARHQEAAEAFRRLSRVEGGVVEADLSETGIASANKFIAYDLYPDARYTVVVSLDPKRAKVSVGSNPWAREPRAHDISRICERYGGGGHPVVGAVSLGPDRLLDARRVAKEIAGILRGPPPR